MKRLAIFSLICAVLCSCSSKTVTIMSYNVGTFNKYCEDSAPEVAALVKGMDIDLLGLCEVDSCTVRTGRRNQTAQLSGLLGKGWEGFFCKALPFYGGSYGIAACSSIKVIDSFQLHLPKGDGCEPRACQVLETKDLFFAVTHLDFTQGTARMQQAILLSESLRERCKGKPVILCGDFNATPDSETLEYMKRDWEIVSECAPSYPSDPARVCIDYIMILKGSAKYEVLDTRVISESDLADVRVTSDHLPVMAKVKITSAAR